MARIPRSEAEALVPAAGAEPGLVIGGVLIPGLYEAVPADKCPPPPNQRPTSRPFCRFYFGSRLDFGMNQR